MSIGLYEIRDNQVFVAGKRVAFAIDVLHYDSVYGSYVSHLRGFHCALENGLTVSTQWGTGNYCANNFVYLLYHEQQPFLEACPDAEMAVFWRTRVATGASDLLDWPNGERVIGHVLADDWWVLVLQHLARLPTGTPDLHELGTSAWWLQTRER